MSINRYGSNFVNNDDSVSQIIQKLLDDVEICAFQTRKDGENAAVVGNVSKNSKENIALCNQDMTQLLSAMEGILVSSRNISKIAKMIGEIATQTNILAINATIEAARAGQHGRGFAVVADEVRKLAEKSQKAAQDTAGLIEESLNQVMESSGIAKKTAGSLDKIAEGVNTIYNLMEEINSSTDIQAQAFARVNAGLSRLSSSR